MLFRPYIHTSQTALLEVLGEKRCCTKKPMSVRRSIYIGFIRSKNSVYNDWVLGFRWKILKIFIIKLKYEGLYLVIHQEGWLLIDNMKLDDIRTASCSLLLAHSQSALLEGSSEQSWSPKKPMSVVGSVCMCTRFTQQESELA